MAPSKVLVFLTQIEYNGLRRWKRKKDGPNQGRPFQLFSRLHRLVDQTLRVSNLSFIEGLLRIQTFVDRLDR